MGALTGSGREGVGEAAHRQRPAVDKDEQPLKGDASKIPGLRPAFSKDGTITAANASSISDGAAALIMTRASTAEAKGLTSRVIRGRHVLRLEPTLASARSSWNSPWVGARLAATP